jgi:hypothetical protein
MKYANGDPYARVYVEVEYKPKELELDNRIYNTAEGLSEYIKDLTTLNHIMNIRAVAYNKKGLRLNEFIWKGILQFDQFGQTMLLSEQKYEDENDIRYLKSRAVSIETFKRYCKQWSGTFEHIPNDSDICGHCGKKWSIEDILNYVKIDEIGYHKECLKERNNELKFLEFQNIFSKVYVHDLSKLKFKMIPNEYCLCDLCASWFIVNTPHGDIKIGWRKRVMQIEWLDNYKEFIETFESEDVTRGFGKYCSDKRYIHARNAENAIEYLIRAKNSIPNTVI